MSWSDVDRSLVAEIPRLLGVACRMILAAVAIAAAKAALASSRALETIAQRIDMGGA